MDEAIEDIATKLKEAKNGMENLMDTFWGRKCLLDVQCYYVFVDTTLVQVSECNKGRGYTGTTTMLHLSTFLTMCYIVTLLQGWMESVHPGCGFGSWLLSSSLSCSVVFVFQCGAASEQRAGIQQNILYCYFVCL